MLANLKKWSIYAIVFICVSGGIFVLGYMVRGWTTAPITITEGEIVERTNIIYKPISGTDNIDYSTLVIKYNSLLNDLHDFLGAVPEVYNVTDSKIFFKIHTQKYALSYSYNPKTHWYVSPMVTAKAALVSTPTGMSTAIAYGGGVSFDYLNFGGAVVFFSDISGALMLYYRIQL
jgi:hypothetical protein